MRDTKNYHSRLLAMKVKLVEKVTAIERDIRHEELSADWSDQATERENDEVLESLGIAAEQELAMINVALQRIENGSYFYCCDCGDDIPSARLDLLPFSPLCVSCAEDLERLS